MSFFSIFKYSSLYERRLSALGLNPRTISPDFHSSICSMAERMAKSTAETMRMSPSEKSTQIEGTITGAADVFAAVHLGPEAIRSKPLYDYVINTLAKDWVCFGERGSFDLELLHQINQAGYLNQAAAQDFFAARDREYKNKT